MKADFLSYLLEASGCLAIFYLFYRLVLHHETAFAANRLFILLTTVLAFVIPLIDIQLQPQTMPILAVALTEIPVFIVNNQSGNLPSVPEILFYGYWFISALLLIQLLIQLLSLWRTVRQRKWANETGYRLIPTDGKLPTFSFFRLLFWDNRQELTQTERRQILAHELVHIRQWHSADVLLMQLARILLWFNPFIYLFDRALRNLHEYQADAVAARTDSHTYVQLLVRQTLRQSPLAFASPFYRLPLTQRIAMIHKFNPAKPAFWKFALSLPVLALVFFVYACSDSDTEAAQPDETTVASNANMDMEQIMDKYRKKYPQIELASVNVEKSTKPSQLRIMVKNVDNPTDKAKIEQELSRAASAMIDEESSENLEKPQTLPEEGTDQIFQEVEVQPAPVGGMEALYTYIGENLTYPEQAQAKKIEGKVFVQFVVNEDGSVSNAQILKGIGYGCDEESVRVLQNMPKWEPGTQKGKPVKVRMSIPIAFKLD